MEQDIQDLEALLRELARERADHHRRQVVVSHAEVQAEIGRLRAEVSEVQRRAGVDTSGAFEGAAADDQEAGGGGASSDTGAGWAEVSGRMGTDEDSRGRSTGSADRMDTGSAHAGDRMAAGAADRGGSASSQAPAGIPLVPSGIAPLPPGGARAPVVPAPAGRGLDVDISEMPFGDLEPFGREDTAQELTEDSIQQSDAMVDQLERAEVAEEKRAVFRALTRLRGAAITSFDGIARSQTGSIDEYARKHSWRGLHPVRHLASEEADTSRWAFPVRAS